MTWILPCLAGVGLGIAFFGGLALMVRVVVGRQRLAPLLALGWTVRFALVGGAMEILARGQPGAVLAVLAGVLVGRWLCITWTEVNGLGL